MEGIPAMNLWDTIVDTLHSSSRYEATPSLFIKLEILTHQNHLETLIVLCTSECAIIQHASFIVHLPRQRSCNKQVNKCRSLTLRHVSRTHRVDFDWLYDRINLDSMIQIKYVNATQLLADILTTEKSQEADGHN